MIEPKPLGNERHTARLKLPGRFQATENLHRLLQDLFDFDRVVAFLRKERTLHQVGTMVCNEGK